MDPARQLRERQQESADRDEPEQDIWTGKYSARTMIGVWIAAATGSVLVLAVVAMFSGEAGRTAWLVGGFVILATWIWLLGLAMYRKLSDHYFLTTQRLKHQNGILFRKSNRIELIDIDDVMFEQGPIQILMGVGTIRIRSSDTSHPELDMMGIADVRKVADLIDDARRDERRKRGLHIEAV